MEFKRLEIPEVIEINPRVFPDDRGFFFEFYKKSEFVNAGIITDFVQDNQSRSSKGTVRGLHYQMDPKAQGKLVKVVQGSIFDVAVDIRKGSPTFGKWVGVMLSAENKKMLWIPEGFAHGFMSLEDDTEITYKNTDEYAPETMRGILWNDPAIGIEWPDVEKAVLSEKDGKAPPLKGAENNFVYEVKK